MDRKPATKTPTTTTLPILPRIPPTLRTRRLLLRPFSPTDLPFFILLRRQPEVMRWTSTGRCDQSIEQTKAWLNRFLPQEEPNSIALCIEELEKPGEVIGSAGFNLFRGQRAEIGYMLRKEVWGRGYATEAVEAVLGIYWSLERRVVILEVEAEGEGEGEDGKMDQEHDAEGATTAEEVDDQRGHRQIETLFAMTEAANVRSRRILERFGFVKVRDYKDAATGGTECMDYILKRPEC